MQPGTTRAQQPRPCVRAMIPVAHSLGSNNLKRPPCVLAQPPVTDKICSGAEVQVPSKPDHDPAMAGTSILAWRQWRTVAALAKSPQLGYAPALKFIRSSRYAVTSAISVKSLLLKLGCSRRIVMIIGASQDDKAGCS